MAGSSMPFVKAQWFDNNGDPANGYQLFVYESGTSTKTATYSDISLLVPNTNPVILDSAGRATVFLAPASYKFVFTSPTDTDPPTSPTWTMDNVLALSPFAENLDISGIAGEILTVNEVAYLSDGSGGTTAGRWYRTDADNTYSSNGAFIIGVVVGTVASGASVTIRKSGRMTGFAGLTIGALYYASATAGAVTSTAPANAVIVGKADTATSIVLGPTPGLAAETVIGLISTGVQTFAGAKTFTTQPQANIGTATTLPATVGGVVVTDTAVHSVAGGSTDAVMTDTEIPANMLNANGKCLYIRIGGSTAMTGANAKTIELDVGGTQVSLRSSSTNDASWWAEVLIVRIDSDSIDVSTIYAGPTLSELIAVTRINGLAFTASIDLRTLGTTGAASTLEQTYFSMEALG